MIAKKRKVTTLYRYTQKLSTHQARTVELLLAGPTWYSWQVIARGVDDSITDEAFFHTLDPLVNVSLP